MNSSRALKNCMIASIACLTMLLAAPVAMASVIEHYTFSGVTMQKGSTMSGSFDWDVSADNLAGFNITLPANNYGPETTFNISNAYYRGPGFFGLGQHAAKDSSFYILMKNNKGYLDMIFDSSLDRGGIVNITLSPRLDYGPPGSYFSHNNLTADYITAGFATTANVPEPATLGLLAIGLLPLIFRRRRPAQPSI